MGTTVKNENSRDKIIEATLRIAAEKGFANTRTADIAKEAGVSEGLIFKYFPSKSALFGLIIQDNFRLIKAGVTRIIENDQITATEKMKELIEFHFHFFTKERNLAQLIFGMSDQVSLAPLPVLEFGLKPYGQLVGRIVTEGVERGEFRPVNPDIMSSVIIGSMQLVLIRKIFINSPFEIADALNEVTEYILAGLRSEKSPKASG